MTATQVRNLSLDDVRTKFGLVETGKMDFFLEWQGLLPEVEGQIGRASCRERVLMPV